MDDDVPLAKGLRPPLAGAGSGEFVFRYNERGIEDAERAAKVLKGITGKRLTYRRIDTQGRNAHRRYTRREWRAMLNAIRWLEWMNNSW